jgi:glycerophosphoryl diester phosphodiesterase
MGNLQCRQPFTPANATSDASALCCTADITIAEYGTLCSKMDGVNASATNVKDYQNGTPGFRTNLYNTCGQVLTLESYIDLVDSLPGHRMFTPELKTPPAAVPMPFNGYTQAQYARDMIETFIGKGIDPKRVWPQSFTPADIYLWLNEYPAFGKQAVYLDEDGDTASNYTVAVNRLGALKASGVNIIAPPYNYLLSIGGPNNDTIVPSIYATTAKEVGLDIISWSFERSGPLDKVYAADDYYWSSVAPIITYDGQAYEALDVLGREIGIIGMFSDWSATVTYYANCFDLEGPVGGKYY